MEVLNYTGKPLGLTNRNGKPQSILPIAGNAKCKVELSEWDKFNLTPIYRKSFGRVTGLPDPDLNLEKFYIVNKDVAEAVGSSRFDLLIVEDPIVWENATFYKTLINVI